LEFLNPLAVLISGDCLQLACILLWLGANGKPLQTSSNLIKGIWHEYDMNFVKP